MAQWFSDLNVYAGYIYSLFLVSIVMLLFFYYRLSSKYSLLQNQIVHLQNEIRAINSGNLGMGRKINQCAEEIAKVEVNHIASDTPQTSEKVYQQAGLLLSRGATIEEVVESCDIAPAEAELLAIMKHSGIRRPAAA